MYYFPLVFFLILRNIFESLSDPRLTYFSTNHTEYSQGGTTLSGYEYVNICIGISYTFRQLMGKFSKYELHLSET
jgi:hypothetical protein